MAKFRDYTNLFFNFQGEEISPGGAARHNAKSPPQSSELSEIELFRLSSAGPMKKENICLLCEEPGDLITCNGPTMSCHNSFHLSCIGLKSAPAGPFVCDECTTGLSECLFVVAFLGVGVCRYTATSTGCPAILRFPSFTSTGCPAIRPANCYGFTVFVTLWRLKIWRYGFAANNIAEGLGSKKNYYPITQQMAPLVDA